MRKLRVVMMALVAVFAFSVVAAATASAETTLLAEWLIEGLPVEASTSTQALGKILLEDKKLAGAPALNCEGTFVGSVDANGQDVTSEVLTEGGALVTQTTPLTLTNGCKIEKTCEEAGGVKVWPVGLPWHTLLYLTEAGAFRDHVFAAAYAVECRVIFVLQTDECKSTESSFGVLASAEGAEATGEVTPNSNCTLGGAGAGTEQFEGANHLVTLTSVPVIPSSGP